MTRHLLRFGLLVSAILVGAPSVFAQTPAARPAPEPPLRRWFELQTFTAYTRYRFVETSAGVVSTNQQQYKEAIRARLNADKKRRYTLNIGAFSGSAFTSSWDNTGMGTGTKDFHNHYVKQLYGAAIPVPGLELQLGGLFFNRGESTEYTTYDDDSYLVGERVSVRRPKTLYLDEISVTRAMVGFVNTPNLFKRWSGFEHPNYTQVLAAKRFSPMVSGSLDYTTQAGADTIRAAVALRFKPTAPLSAVRYEQYKRLNAHAAAGFSISGERPITKWFRFQGGYATIDALFGGLNADRINRGRRLFGLATIPIAGPLSSTIFVTQAFHADYAISNRTRVDLVLQYDVLAVLRKTGKI